MITTIKNDLEAVAVGLALAITARTERESRQALRLTESLAAGLAEQELVQAKAQALQLMKGGQTLPAN
jgi:hypothetical protein